MESSAIAYGRVGLLGNPSDIYGGKCISFTFNKSAQVIVKDSDKFSVHGNGEIDNDFYSNNSNNLVKAVIKHLELGEKASNLEIHYKSDIPVGSGLAGSSAIIIAATRALSKHFNLMLDDYAIAESALHTEIDELGIAGGFQDRYSISFGGVLYMDFSGKEMIRKQDAYAKIKELNISELPFFLCLGMKPKSSAKVHNSVREEYLRGGPRSREIQENMDEIAELARYGVGSLLAENWEKLGDLMNINHALREKMFATSEADREMISKAIKYGAYGAKLAGSGGAVVVLGNDNVLEKMLREFPCLKPEIAEY